jgi:hypothetical protein
LWFFLSLISSPYASYLLSLIISYYLLYILSLSYSFISLLLFCLSSAFCLVSSVFFFFYLPSRSSRTASMHACRFFFFFCNRSLYYIRNIYCVGTGQIRVAPVAKCTISIIVSANMTLSLRTGIPHVTPARPDRPNMTLCQASILPEI